MNKQCCVDCIIIKAIQPFIRVKKSNHANRKRNSTEPMSVTAVSAFGLTTKYTNGYWVVINYLELLSLD